VGEVALDAIRAWLDGPRRPIIAGTTSNRSAWPAVRRAERKAAGTPTGVDHRQARGRERRAGRPGSARTRCATAFATAPPGGGADLRIVQELLDMRSISTTQLYTSDGERIRECTLGRTEGVGEGTLARYATSSWQTASASPCAPQHVLERSSRAAALGALSWRSS